MQDIFKAEGQRLVFRFRSAGALLDGFKELENQEIYFCPYAELNDPAEGNLNVYWQGDRIVWQGFFRHYFTCLFSSWALVSLGFEEYRRIPVWKTWDEFNISAMLDRFFALEEMRFVLDMIGDHEDRLSENELEVYLLLLNIRAVEIVASRMNDSVQLWKKGAEFPKYDGLSLHAYGESDRKLMFEALNDVLEVQVESLRLTMNGDDKTAFLLLDYPKSYIGAVRELMFPKWYVSSFCQVWDDSRMWAAYADDHKGACLIFKTVDSGSAVRLNTCHSWSSSRGYVFELNSERLRDIEYSDSFEAINFFEMLGNAPAGMLKKLFTDDDGNVSKYWVYDDNDRWRKEYWQHMDKTVSRKTEAWKQEKECRIVLESGMVMDYSSPESRKIKYEFSDLAGMILGMRMTDDDKRQVIRILENKCSENGISNFPIYQEKLDRETGRIKLAGFKEVG